VSIGSLGGENVLKEMHAASPTPGSVAAAQWPVLRLENLSKTFGGTRALRDVTLEIAPGEIHALVGQNGCGKSTLIKTLAGYHDADPGALAWLDGEPFDLSATTDARHDRLRFVHQDLGLVTELSAVDNLALSRGYARTRLGSIDWSAQERSARALIGRFGMDIDVHRPLMYATPVECTVVAIAAALEGWEGGRGVLVLDEPTAVLPHTEVDRLLEIVREVRRTGTSVLYVSHRMNEIFDIADRVTVLRGGKVIGTRDVADLTPQTLATMMVGTDVDISVRPEATTSERRPQLEVRDLRAGVLRGVSFELRKGEVLGIAGLPGSGRETLPYAIAGAWEGSVSGALRLPAKSDAWIDLADDDAPRFPLVPANRTTEGVIGAFTVKENLTLPLIGRLRGRAAISAGREAELVDGWIERLGIRTAGLDAPITTLSGGNQQKVVMARCLALDSSVVALCEPTAGVDIGTRVQLYDLIAEQARAGLGVIVSSSDEGDLLGMCTRVLVLRRGEIATELTGDEITEPKLLHAMEGSD
jgi:ABC-type sugar transport system ATPase subunit